MVTAGQSPQQTEKAIHILSASIDAGLNHSRALLLRSYGFEVVTSESLDDARSQIEAGHFDVLIFGSTLPRDTCWQLAQVFRNRNSRGKIIEILPTTWAAPKNRPDATVASTDVATMLINTIQEGLM
jgi:DNA-binding NtrC family response regulator